MNKFLVRLGIVLAVLAVLTTTATADNVVYFDPDPSCAVSGETITVTMWLNATDGCGAIEGDIYFDLDVVNITSGTPGDFPLMWGFVHYGHFVRYGGWSPTGLNISGHLKMADFTLVANNSGTSVLNNNENNNMGDQYGHILPDQVWMNGTFNCLPTPETFTKDLSAGWNLISLPLTPENNSTSAVLGNDTIEYDAVYSYDATSKLFEDVMTGTMNPGNGYFVNVTTAATWTYNGTAYTSMTVDLKQGLNLVGWTNTSGLLPDVLDNSIAGKYNYVAQWTSPNYEVYDANAPPGVPEFIDFTEVTRGNGYWITAKEDCTLSV